VFGSHFIRSILLVLFSPVDLGWTEWRASLLICLLLLLWNVASLGQMGLYLLITLRWSSHQFQSKVLRNNIPLPGDSGPFYRYPFNYFHYREYNLNKKHLIIREKPLVHVWCDSNNMVEIWYEHITEFNKSWNMIRHFLRIGSMFSSFKNSPKHK